VVRFLAFSLRRAWQGFWRNALMSLAATATMVLMLLLLAGFWILQAGLMAGLQFVEQKVQIVADLRDDAPSAEVDALRRRLLAEPTVSSVDYVSKEEALARFREQLAAQGQEDLTQYLDTNPLRASLEVKLADPRAAGSIVDELRAAPIVESVTDIQNLVDRVLTVTSILRTAGAVVLVVVGLIVLFIVVNTIRLAVLARAARALARGGTFLLVGHDLANLGASAPGPSDPNVLYTPEDIVRELPDLRVIRAHRVTRRVALDDGQAVAIDALVRAVSIPA